MEFEEMHYASVCVRRMLFPDQYNASKSMYKSIPLIHYLI